MRSRLAAPERAVDTIERSAPPSLLTDHAAMQDRFPMREKLRTPRAAAVAGLLFSVLVIAIFLLVRLSVPADPREPGAWLTSHAQLVTWAVNLFPFAAIAFLWFIGVLRDRIGQEEDRFFSTVFLGSGLLFLGMLLILAIFVSGIVGAFETHPLLIADSAAFYFARSSIYNVANVYMAKMAGVFMMTTSMVVIYTGIAPRWLAIVGLTLAPLLLFGSYYLTWVFMVFPLWVMLISANILKENLGRPS
jgi:MFS family permease